MVIAIACYCIGAHFCKNATAAEIVRMEVLVFSKKIANTKIHENPPKTQNSENGFIVLVSSYCLVLKSERDLYIY